MKQQIDSSWKLQKADIPNSYQEWVLYSGSFMQRLNQQGIVDAKIQVLQQRWLRPEAEERNLLSMGLNTQALVREVLIFSEKKQWMFARTVIPRNTLTGEERQLAHLEDRPLGSVLFKDPTMKRGEFEFACFHPGEKWHNKVTQIVKQIFPDLWARRSIFFLRDKSLLLTEIFLPDITTI